MKTTESEENVRKTLDELFKKAKESKNPEDLNELRFTLDDYIEQGHKLKDYIYKYNELVIEIGN